MDNLLKQLCEKNGLDYKIIQEIIKIEKDNVYKKRRNIFGDMKEVIDKVVEKESILNDN
ncbi:MAG: DNA modification system-associated small protein [Ignavibacteriales bacterium]